MKRIPEIHPKRQVNRMSMLERLSGNEPLKESVRAMLVSRRLTHSVLLVGEKGVGTGFAARCIAADHLFPQGGPSAEAMVRGECCKAVATAGKRDSGRIETGVVREAVSVTGAGSGGRYLVGQVIAMRSEVYNSSLTNDNRAAILYDVQNMNEESANALLKVLEEPPEGVLFLLTADSLAGVLPTIRSRCVSFAVSPAPVEECERYCIAQGVDARTARLYSTVFDGRIGTVLQVARDPQRRQQLDTARSLANAAAAHDCYAAAVLLAAFEKDKPAAVTLLSDLSALAAATLRQPGLTNLSPAAAVNTVRCADDARQRLNANGNTRLVLTRLASRFGRV